MKKIQIVTPYDIDSSESFFNNFFIRGNNLIVPFINLGISEHPINTSNRLKYIDRTFFIAENMTYLALSKSTKSSQYYSKEVIIDIQDYSQLNSFHLGGNNISFNNSVVEIEVQCNCAYLLFLDDTQLSNTFWVPPVSKSKSFSVNILQESFDMFINYDLNQLA